MTMSTVMSWLQGSPQGESASYSPGAFLTLSVRNALHPSKLFLNWPESSYGLPHASINSKLSSGAGEGCRCPRPEFTLRVGCILNLEKGSKDGYGSEGMDEFEEEEFSWGFVALEQCWMLGSLSVGYPALEVDHWGESQVRLSSRGSAQQREASVLFRGLVSMRGSMHSKLQSRPISAVVSDWQMKWDWDLVLDKVSELNARCTQQNAGSAKPGGGTPRVGVIAQWWKGVRRSEEGGKLTWQVLTSGSWEVW